MKCCKYFRLFLYGIKKWKCSLLEVVLIYGLYVVMIIVYYVYYSDNIYNVNIFIIYDMSNI